MKLGPLQKRWIQILRDNPDKQGKHKLGFRSINDEGEEIETFCCLGMAAKMLLGETPIRWSETGTKDNLLAYFPGLEKHSLFLEESFPLLGLKDGFGSILDGDKDGFLLDGVCYSSLVHMNDKGVPWSKMTDFIEAHPELVFERSV